MLEPKYCVLSELFERRLFKIPDYQRAYSWEARQRSDLFEDIKKLLNASKDRHHFMASIVCHESGEDEIVGAEEFKILDVVDGQQRLTTLVIAPGKARHIFRGESPRRERVSHPPVSSLALVAEQTWKFANKTGEA